MSSADTFDIDRACDDATRRVNDYINRAAGQHRRAITREFWEAAGQRESRTRHHLTLVRSITKPNGTRA